MGNEIDDRRREAASAPECDRGAVACAKPSIIGNNMLSFMNLQSAIEKPLARTLSAKVILFWLRVETIFITRVYCSEC